MVNPLYQRLKELPKQEFENLIDALLKARYPSAGISRVNGAGGDLGVDSYQGRFGGSIAIWQDKHFPNGVGSVQRRQILESIQTAFENHSPESWTLCVPIDLTPSERAWFDETIVDPYEKKAKIDLMQASNIVFELLYHKRIRESFFPDAISDVTALRKMALNTDHLTPADSARIGFEHFSQATAEWEATDPRFRFEIATNILRSEGILGVPGLLASVFDGRMRIDVYARDLVALQNDPIKMLVALSRTGQEKAQYAARTGRGAKLEKADLIEVRLPAVIQQLVGQKSVFENLDIRPQSGKATIPTRVSIREDREITRQYRYVRFNVKYWGTDEVTIESTSGLPIPLSLQISRLNDSCIFSADLGLYGWEFKRIQQAFEFCEALSRGAILEIEILETEGPALQIRADGPLSGFEVDEPMKLLVADALAVSKYLGCNLRAPSAPPTAEDYALLETLKYAATGEEFTINRIDFILVKDDTKQSQFESFIQNGQGNQMIFQSLPEQQVKTLFGEPISTGQLTLEADRLTLQDPEVARKTYLAAQNGDPIPIVALGPSKARYIRWTADASNPAALT